jgi:hypothetical protein
MENLFKAFNQKFLGKARIAVIGGEIRKMLAENNKWYFPDLTVLSHFDILIELQNLNDSELVKEIFNYFGAKFLTNLCYVAELNGFKLEFVGVLINERLFTVKMEKNFSRPDLTIERFGYYNDLSVYDGSGRGFDDFFSRKIVLMHDNLFLRKYLKILSLKFQTGFNFDTHTAEVICRFEDTLDLPKHKKSVFQFDYNYKLFKSYSTYDKNDYYQIGIHVALLYLRARDKDEVTNYIESHYRLKSYLAQAGVNYYNFEMQAKSRDF